MGTEVAVSLASCARYCGRVECGCRSVLQYHAEILLVEFVFKPKRDSGSGNTLPFGMMLCWATAAVPFRLFCGKFVFFIV